MPVQQWCSARIRLPNSQARGHSGPRGALHRIWRHFCDRYNLERWCNRPPARRDQACRWASWGTQDRPPRQRICRLNATDVQAEEPYSAKLISQLVQLSRALNQAGQSNYQKTTGRNDPYTGVNSTFQRLASFYSWLSTVLKILVPCQVSFLWLCKTTFQLSGYFGQLIEKQKGYKYWTHKL